MRFLTLSVLMAFLCLSGSVRAEQKNQSKLFLPPPIWACINTVGNNVELNWLAVNDPGGTFVRYEVHSLQDGYMANITNINGTNYTDVNVTTAKDYFIVVIDNTTANSSDTLKNIRLNLNNPSDGTAILQWNSPMRNVSIPLDDKSYIYREYPTGTFAKRDSMSFASAFYKDTIDICSAFLNYQIRYPGNGCVSTSNVVGDNFEDKTTPDIPVVQKVSIDTLSGQVELTWNVNRQRDTYGYVIYKKNAGGFLVEIDTVWGRNNVVYSYVEPLTSQGPLTYSVAAFDSCFTQTLPPTYQTSAKGAIHTSTFLSGTYNSCLSAVSLNWSAYFGWNAVQNYEVFATDDQNNWQSQGVFTSNQHTVYFQSTGLFTFVVEAHHADGRSAFSNKIQVQVTTKGPPTVNYLQVASIENEHVLLRHLVDTAGNVGEVAFERQQKDGNFREIGRVAVVGPSSVFIDLTADDEQLNSYRAVIIDSCGNSSTVSDTCTTVVLTVVSDKVGYRNELSWTPYIGFDGGVSSHEIYRIVDGKMEPNPIGVVNASTYNFTDDLGTLYGRENICYYVAAMEGPNSYNSPETAKSNVACSKFDPLIYIPNAFTPNGANPFFKPEFSYIDYPSYSMKIFNRWGRVVHESVNAEPGWNGRILDDGEDAEPAVYIYRILFTDEEGKELFYEGAFTLLR